MAEAKQKIDIDVLETVPIPKEYKMEDLTGAKDEKTALKVYLGLSKSGASESLQKTMAEQMLRLDNTDAAIRFAVLSQETRNVEVMKTVRDGVYEASQENKNAVGRFVDAVDRMPR